MLLSPFACILTPDHRHSTPLVIHMCPILLLSILGSVLVLFAEAASAFNVSFSPDVVDVEQDDLKKITFTIHPSKEAEQAPGLYQYAFSVSDEGIARIKGDQTFFFRNDPSFTRNWSNALVVEGVFLGVTSVRVQQVEPQPSPASAHLPVIVRRGQSLISKVFIYSVAILVSLTYVNMGCALDLKVVGSVLRRPIAPSVGLLSQYLIMPVAAYFLGLWLFSDAMHLRLGLFIFGCSPAGGASNMWTVLLRGNLDLSITMTFISTLLATGKSVARSLPS